MKRIRFGGGLAVFAACAVTILSCDHRSPTNTTTEVETSPAPEVIETQWTESAAKRAEALADAKKTSFGLPELRVYDKSQQLVLHQSGFNPQNVAETIGAAIRTGRVVAGPTYGDTVADLETHDHRPAAGLVKASSAVTVFDYWASWCAPCKILEKQLFAWAAQQPQGSVRIVRVEADLVKLEKARGEKVYMFKKGPDGKLVRVEMK